jgi:hypothetical protein
MKICGYLRYFRISVRIQVSPVWWLDIDAPWFDWKFTLMQRLPEVRICPGPEIATIVDSIPTTSGLTHSNCHQ